MIPFECKRNELTIRGNIYGELESKKPVIIMSHGFGANLYMCEGYAQMYADMGFISVAYDFCGGGADSRSDGRTEDMTVFTETDDLKAVIEYIKNQPYTESISLLGCSQGGFVSAIVAAELKNQIKSLMLLYPALCIPDDARSGKMLSYSFDINDIPETLGEPPMRLGGNYARCVLDINPYEIIKGYDGPTLFLHGTEDAIVDISYARKARKSYSNIEYFEIIDGGHVFFDKADESARMLLTNFAERCLQ